MLGPAQTRWNDYVGTCAADGFGADASAERLYEMTALDPASWTILTVDVETTDRQSTITAYAFDRSAHVVDAREDLLDLADRLGELPVTAFELVLPSTGFDPVHSLFPRVAVRLTVRSVSDQRLVVQDRRRIHDRG